MITKKVWTVSAVVLMLFGLSFVTAAIAINARRQDVVKSVSFPINVSVRDSSGNRVMRSYEGRGEESAAIEEWIRDTLSRGTPSLQTYALGGTLISSPRFSINIQDTRVIVSFEVLTNRQASFVREIEKRDRVIVGQILRACTQPAQ